MQRGRGLVWLLLHPPPNTPRVGRGSPRPGLVVQTPRRLWRGVLNARGRGGDGARAQVWSSAKRLQTPLSPPGLLQFPFASKQGQHPPLPISSDSGGPIPLLFVVSFHQLPACRHAAPAPMPAVAPQPSPLVLRSGRPAAVSRAPGIGPGRSVGSCCWPAQF